jgi:hypothetical protein
MKPARMFFKNFLVLLFLFVFIFSSCGTGESSPYTTIPAIPDSTAVAPADTTPWVIDSLHQLQK